MAGGNVIVVNNKQAWTELHEASKSNNEAVRFVQDWAFQGTFETWPRWVEEWLWGARQVFREARRLSRCTGGALPQDGPRAALASAEVGGAWGVRGGKRAPWAWGGPWADPAYAGPWSDRRVGA